MEQTGRISGWQRRDSTCIVRPQYGQAEFIQEGKTITKEQHNKLGQEIFAYPSVMQTIEESEDLVLFLHNSF